MREIRFRAWDKKKKEMEYMNNDYPETEYGDLHNFLHYIEIEGRFEDIILLQYIGLNDKNGKEIWEGDIIKADEKGTIFENVVAPIIFNRGAFRFKCFEGFEKVLEGTEKFIEIIGNIYENPNLLKDVEVLSNL